MSMQRRLVFGVDRDPGVAEELVGHSKYGTAKANPMLVLGPGPIGATCATCDHLYMRGDVSGRYYKCDLRRDTRGPSSDHRVRWPACARYEREAT